LSQLTWLFVSLGVLQFVVLSDDMQSANFVIPSIWCRWFVDDIEVLDCGNYEQPCWDNYLHIDLALLTLPFCRQKSSV